MKFMGRVFSSILSLAISNANNVRRIILPILSDMVVVEYFCTKTSLQDSQFLDVFIFELDARMPKCSDGPVFRRQLCDELKNRCQPDSQLCKNGADMFINKV